jgi:hypothetical protein
MSDIQDADDGQVFYPHPVVQVLPVQVIITQQSNVINT